MGNQSFRVAIVVDATAYGGAEAYAAHLLRHLPQSVGRVLVATEPPPEPLAKAAAETGAGPVLVPPVRGKLDLGAIGALWRALRAASADVVHVMMATPSNNRYALAGGTLAGRPLVVTLHLWTPITSRVQRGLLRTAYGRASRVIAVSDEIARTLHRELLVSRARLRVVPGGVEDAPPVTPGSRAPIRIGALGRARPQKGFDVLIEATRLLVGDGRDLEVVIGGDGPDLADLRRRAGDLPVRFEGFVEDVPGFLASVDAFCLPSRFEGVPLALLEAMIRGLPCVATSVGGVPETLDGAGILVPPGDATRLAAALGRLLDSPGDRAALGERARRRAAERFTVEAMAAATADVYREALAR